MGCLRADALISARLIIERRAASIGTLAQPSQRKLCRWLACSLLLGSALPGTARAAGQLPPPSPSASGSAGTAGSAPPPPPTSPFTGTGDGPAAAPLPRPPPGAPPAAPALPAPPPPKGTRPPVARPTAAAEAPPGSPGSDLPPPPPPPRGVRYHDGFYLRMALGVGASGALVSSDASSVPNYSFAGGGGTGDLWIGGTPTPGLALGGALSVLGVSSTSRRVDGGTQSAAVTGSTGVLGFFVDGFPDPEKGFHFGGTFGLASGRAEVKEPDTKFAGGGVGLGAWLGYDLWVGPQWSLGGMLRLMGSITHQETGGVNYETSLGGASLSFTALYH